MIKRRARIVRIVSAAAVALIITLVSIAAIRAAMRTRPTLATKTVDPAADAALIVSDVAVLQGLEARGLSFGRVMAASGEIGQALQTSPLVRVLTAAVTDEVVTRHRDDPTTSYGPGSYSRALRHLFDPAWLSSDHSHFELVGVVNRLDRALMDPESCGEIRLIYRLALTPPGRPTTRLPMTVNVLFPQLPQPRVAEDCRAVATEWLAIERASKRVGLLAALVDHPLRDIDEGARRAHYAFDRVEINFQLLHEEPRAVDTDDHSEYVLRGFRRADGALVEDALIDTPSDSLDETGRARLAAWVAENLNAVDAGNAIIPARILGSPQTRALSFAPRGLARRENRPFGRLFPDPAVFARAFESPSTGAGQRLVHSPAALVRRLDQMTCTGCHATRSIAGFHLVGDERDATASFGALFGGRSRHLEEELVWRRRYLTTVAEGRAALFDEPRPIPEHDALDGDGRPSERGLGSFGARCGLPGDDDATFSRWKCASGLTCRRAYGDDELGSCTPDVPHAGDACEVARRGPEHGAAGPVLTRVGNMRSCRPTADLPSQAGGPFTTRCFANRAFPGGMCSVMERCLADDPRAVCAPSDPVPHIVPGHLYGDPESVEGVTIGLLAPRIRPKENCVEVDAPIEACAARPDNGARVLARACDASQPCRDDFTCVRVENEKGGAPAPMGACVPPYFVYQMRVDGPRLDRL